MNCVGAAGAHRIDDAVDAKVALARRAGADGDRLICHADVPRGAIAFGIHRHRREAKVTTRADDAHRDLPAVGDEDLAQNQAILASSVGRLRSDADENYSTTDVCRRCEAPFAPAVRLPGVIAQSHSGMLPCFFGGLRSRFVSNADSAAITFARVWLGRITSSMKPRSAATYGLANFSRYSAMRAARAAATSAAASSSRL